MITQNKQNRAVKKEKDLLPKLCQRIPGALRQIYAGCSIMTTTQPAHVVGDSEQGVGVCHGATMPLRAQNMARKVNLISIIRMMVI